MSYARASVCVWSVGHTRRPQATPGPTRRAPTTRPVSVTSVRMAQGARAGPPSAPKGAGGSRSRTPPTVQRDGARTPLPSALPLQSPPAGGSQVVTKDSLKGSRVGGQEAHGLPARTRSEARGRGLAQGSGKVSLSRAAPYGPSPGRRPPSLRLFLFVSPPPRSSTAVSLVV